jgi:hypothetical protein
MAKKATVITTPKQAEELAFYGFPKPATVKAPGDPCYVQPGGGKKGGKK